MSLIIKEQLPSVAAVRARLPLPPEAAAAKRALETALAGILAGNDRRRVLIIGPCAADDEDAVMEYVRRLSLLQAEVQERLLLVARIYTAKPRASFSGYTGMLHSPHPGGPKSIPDGILAARRLHLRALTECGLLSADELLYCDLADYLLDVISYLTVGARSAENQTYAWLASGLDCPVGIKNPRCGEPGVLVHAVCAAQQSNDFSLGGQAVQSTGNPYAHGVLRGYTDAAGVSHSNAGADEILRTVDLLRQAGVAHPGVIIDCSHDNSGKDVQKQCPLCLQTLAQMRRSPALAEAVRGFMIESYLLPGNCGADAPQRGRSVVDACLGWEDTRQLVLEAAALVP